MQTLEIARVRGMKVGLGVVVPPECLSELGRRRALGRLGRRTCSEFAPQFGVFAPVLHELLTY